MTNITTLGIDLAKNVFQVHAADQFGHKLWSKRVSRTKLRETIMKLPTCLIGMEACGSAHHWGRVFKDMGHQVKLMSPQYVKPYIKTNKNDANDAEGICEAVTRPHMRFVPIKTIAQQNLSAIHRARRMVVTRRVQVSNHLRGMLSEYGIICQQGYAGLNKLVEKIKAGDYEIFSPMPLWLSDMIDELEKSHDRVKAYDQEIKRQSVSSETAKRLLTIPGVGPISATAIEAKLGNVSSFNKGRDLSAFLGLVPKQNSSGGKERLCGISKRGDKYLRTLLIHGARSLIYSLAKKTEEPLTYYERWILALVSRVGMNKAVVALANKNTRIIWALLKHGRSFDPNFAQTFVQQDAA